MPLLHNTLSHELLHQLRVTLSEQISALVEMIIIVVVVVAVTKTMLLMMRRLGQGGRERSHRERTITANDYQLGDPMLYEVANGLFHP